MENLSASPCSNPELGLEEALEAYAGLGYKKFEVFTGWAKSAFDIHEDPGSYRELGKKYSLTFSSLHLPPVQPDLGDSLQEAITGMEFARAIGAPIALFKAADRPTYIKAAGPFLDATEQTGVIPVLQNHFGTPITTLEDFKEVTGGINDRRMKTLLEVGHFEKAGIPWQKGYDLLKGSIALVHLKDMQDKEPVPFGTGTVDFTEIFETMDKEGYTGDYVVEMEVCRDDTEKTLQYLKEAREHLVSLTKGVA